MCLYLSGDEILVYVPARNNNENKCKGIAWHRICFFHRTLDHLCFTLGSVRLFIFFNEELHNCYVFQLPLSLHVFSLP